MPCSYCIHHKVTSESDESSQITVVTDNNGYEQMVSSLYGNARALQFHPSNPQLEQPAGDKGERLFRAKDEIGLDRDIWNALPSYPHNSWWDEIILPWHTKDSGYL